MLFTFSRTPKPKTFHSAEKATKNKIKITELIIAFFFGLSYRPGWRSIFVCTLRLPYLISNMKQARREEKGEIRNSHNRINFNDQWAFAFLFSSKKSYFAYKNTRNQLVCQRERKCFSRLARLFFLLHLDFDFFIFSRLLVFCPPRIPNS